MIGVLRLGKRAISYPNFFFRPAKSFFPPAKGHDARVLASKALRLVENGV